ncbi:MAG: hypothetical protein J6T48_12680 [Bacteroidales bacterium]|nr:hypothetical protein [Bacteroidales bacterium]
MKLRIIPTLTLIILLIGITTFSSCDIDTTKSSTETISTDITSATTWESDKTYIIEKDNLYISDVLTIEPGTTIKIMSGGNIIIKSKGNIVANGTSAKPIVFTSVKDDNHGDDTNKDGDNTIPAAGDWGYINLNGSQNSSFENCLFLYGGRDNANPATVDVSSEATATFNNCTFAYNSGNLLNNIYVGALNASNASKDTKISNCKFYGNKVPVTINAEMSIDNSNSFSNEGTANKCNGIFVSGSNVSSDISWLEDEVAFVVTAPILQIDRSQTLTLGDNVVIKFTEHSSLTVMSGEGCLINHDGPGVFFTSIKDDEHKGDTNGDGDETSPDTADWTGIYLDNWKSTNGYANWNNILYNDPLATAK